MKMTLMRGFVTITALTLLVVAAPSSLARARKFSLLYSFGARQTFPEQPAGLIAQGRDGELYSTTPKGGINLMGTVFKINRNGKLTVLYNFDGAHGSRPYGGLVLGTDGNFYGTTSEGGNMNDGTIFRMTPAGDLTVLYNFSGSDGAGPEAAPIEGTDGNLYAVTGGGGSGGYGTVYSLTPTGTLTTLHAFNGQGGAEPQFPLIQAKDGNFYGTTFFGATGNEGNVFKVSGSGMFSVLYNFGKRRYGGALPTAGLIQGYDGKFYGTTSSGGQCTCGDVFSLTPTGKFGVLHNFFGYDGDYPGQLIQTTDGKFYGVATMGESGACQYGCGALFRVGSNPASFSVVLIFKGTNGANPSALIQHTDGLIYGVTSQGGLYNEGVFLSLNEGMLPFLNLVPTSGTVGVSIGILGQGFKGTSGVSFNGVPASFTVVSDTYLTATVPQGATTGYVTVTEQGEKPKSSQEFVVVQ